MGGSNNSNNTHGSPTKKPSKRSGMFEPYIYDTRGVQERQFQRGPPPTPEQQNQSMQRRIDNFDQRFYGSGSNPTPRR